MRALLSQADFRSSNSAAAAFRRRRSLFFRSLLERLPRPVRILDVGGTETFWKKLGFADDPSLRIDVLNLDAQPPSSSSNLTVRQGDARDLAEFASGSLDVVFSNSCIEHVGGLEEQRRMASEVQRVGRAFFVQTPNRNFPLEPHFLFPFFQFLSVDAQVYLLTHFRLGWSDRLQDPDEARRVAQSVRLLDRRTLRSLFPTAEIWDERVLGMTKSFVAYSGFPVAPAP